MFYSSQREAFVEDEKFVFRLIFFLVQISIERVVEVFMLLLIANELENMNIVLNFADSSSFVTPLFVLLIEANLHLHEI